MVLPFLSEFSSVCCDHTIKSCGVVSEVDVFLKLLCFLHESTNFGNLISGSSASSKLSLHIQKFSVHVMQKPTLKNFEHNLGSM